MINALRISGGADVNAFALGSASNLMSIGLSRRPRAACK